MICPLPALAAGVSFDERRVGSLKFGLVCGSDTAELMDAPDTALGHVQKRQAWQEIIAETQVIPLTRGLGFGVDMLPAAPNDLNGVRITVTHPPYIGSNVTKDSWVSDFSATGSNLNFFEFEHAFEFVEGEWTMSARKGFRELFSVTFQVVSPETLPQYQSICDGVSLTS